MHALKLMKIISKKIFCNRELFKKHLDIIDITKIQIQVGKNVTNSGKMETISTFLRFQQYQDLQDIKQT